MAAAVCTPIKSHASMFSSRTAGNRAPLTPSPHTRAVSNSSPYTPDRQETDSIFKSSYGGGSLATHFQKSVARRRDSPKSNIAKYSQTPRSALDLGISDFALVTTGTKTPASSKRKSTVRTKAAKTTISYGDRFIPNRNNSSGLTNAGCAKPDSAEKRSKSTDRSSVLDGCADDISSAFGGLNIDDEQPSTTYSRPSPNTVAYQDSLANACGISTGTRILQFKPAAPESSRPIDLRSQYNRPLKPATSGAQFRRKVATAPERVLDAPGLLDDYYLNLLDWSSGNQVAIGLENSVYVWSAESGTVENLCESSPDTYVSSVKWSDDGAYVAVGLGSGEVQIWDVEEKTKLRSMTGHDTRVGVMGWSKHTLSTGARSGMVFNHDVRIAQHKTAELVNHTSEVCGLEWRPDGSQLATGGNDNLVTIWDARSLSVPKFSKTNHKAAVKALAWCPWQPNLLATGGGSYDRMIHYWNSTSGARVNSIDTGSQVTSLRWSPYHREIVSTSGFPDNSISLWSYPSLVRNVEIPAHESRVLHSCLSPDGTMLATAASDESLKFWRVFEKKGKGVREEGSVREMAKQMTIR